MLLGEVEITRETNKPEMDLKKWSVNCIIV
jgi:hypothetical protein